MSEPAGEPGPDPEAGLDPEHQARFDAAVERTRTRVSVTPLWLAHHYPDDYERCVRMGDRHVCRRCLVLYPIAVLVAVLGVAGLALADPWSAIALVALPLPAVAEVLYEQLGRRPYSARRQVAATIPLGLGLGVGFARYLDDHTDPLFWAVAITYTAVCFGAIAWRWRDRTRT